MNIKLKGSRLEAEIDKARGECNWARLTELLPSIRSKNGGIDHLTKRENCTPQKHYYDFLRDSENLLQNAATINKEETTIVMEAYILLAKLHFFCAEYAEALQDIEKSKIDAARTQFITLRSLKLAAESYAIKGFSLEHINHKERQSKPVHNSHDLSRKRILSCFETSVELSISYISELQKSINSKPRGASTSTTLIGYSTKNLKIGLLLEMALERAPYLSLRKSVSDRRWDLDGRIMTELSDKSMVDKVQQKLCRQLAEVLMRGMLEKLELLYWLKHQLFRPQSRFEEVILLLLISEIIASQLMRINRAEGMRSENGDQHSEVSIGEKTMSINNLKMVHNLLVLVLSNLRQYHLLASIFERSMDFAQEDRYMHLQFSLALIVTTDLSAH
uniref:Tetratricopeptide repeat protein 7 N-terminal domain-containing protein n=1 Tax=Ditylenchus dipsaci TaxID=166011 RepID=A0A915EDQ4_9BILA